MNNINKVDGKDLCIEWKSVKKNRSTGLGSDFINDENVISRKSDF